MESDQLASWIADSEGGAQTRAKLNLYATRVLWHLPM